MTGLMIEVKTTSDNFSDEILINSRAYLNDDLIAIYNDKTEDLFFLATQIAKKFGYAEVRNLYSTLDVDEFRLCSYHTLNKIKDLRVLLGEINPRGMTLISEDGTYHAAFKSDKPEPKKFRKLVTSVILPSIRKTGEKLKNIAKNLKSIDYLPNSKYITIENGIALTTSKLISDNFGIRHDNLLQYIDRKINSIQNLDNENIINKLNLIPNNKSKNTVLRSQDGSLTEIEINANSISTDVINKMNNFINNNFIEYFYVSKDNRTIRQYKLTEQAFSFIVMGLSGMKADIYKVAFTEAFYDMRKIIQDRVKSTYLRNAFPEKNTNSQYVYIIKNPFNNNIKVGISKHVERRLKELQTGAGIELELVYKSMLCTNAIEIESAVHKKYVDCRVFGEWFSYNQVQEVIDYIEVCLVKLESNFESLQEMCDSVNALKLLSD